MNARTLAARAWQVRPTLLELGAFAVLVGLAHVVLGLPLVLVVSATLACLAAATVGTAAVELREEQRETHAPHTPDASGGEPS